MPPRKRPERLRTFEVQDVHGGTPVRITDVEADGTSARFETAVHPDPWQITGTVRIVQGRVVITELTVGPNPQWQDTDAGEIVHQDHASLPEAGGVTSATLRAIHLGPLLQGIRAQLLAEPEAAQRFADQLRQAALDQGVDLDGPSDEYLAAATQAAERIGDPPKRGRKGYGDDFYRDVARTYLSLLGQGWTKGILNEMARLADRPRDTIATWVREARKREFLTPGTPGRAGAEPGPKLETDDEKDER